MSDSNGAIASRLLTAWTSGDFEAARALLADDVTFVGPLAHTEGADAYVEGVRGMAKMIKVADQKRVIEDGDDVCIIYDLVTDTPAGAIPTAGWYQLRDGKVSSIRAYFDPRPLIP
jgi:ketosteroid isomerase-like protein